MSPRGPFFSRLTNKCSNFCGTMCFEIRNSDVHVRPWSVSLRMREGACDGCARYRIISGERSAGSQSSAAESSKEHLGDVFLVLPLVEDGKNRPQKPAERTGRITEARESEIIHLIVDRGPLGRASILESLGLSASRTKELLSGMVSKGLLVPEGVGRARVYRLPEGGDE